LLQAFLAAGPGLKVPPTSIDTPPSRSTFGSVTIDDTSDGLLISNGLLTIVAGKSSGLSSYFWARSRKVRDAYSSAELNGTLKSTGYARHRYEGRPVVFKDTIGTGRRVTIVSTADHQPDLLQHYSLYEGKPFFLVQTEIRSFEPVSTNYIGAIVVDSLGGVDIGTINQNRVLRVPFDNDMWFRYNAMDINSSEKSSEVMAVYDNGSRNGLIFGSVTHDTWKTGLRFSGSNGRLNQLEIFSGMATEGVKSATHDSLPHGKVSGRSITSAVIFVGYYEDWRDGLEEYGRANSVFKAPIPWKQSIPFGWNSWAAYGGHINYAKYVGAVDFISRTLAPNGFNSDKIVYHNFDSYWSRLDASQLRDALGYLKNLGQSSGIEYRPGIYMAPFAEWGANLDDFVEGTHLQYRYRDILLKKPDGTPLPKLASGSPLDPTHPGTKARIRTYISTFRELGFRYIKLDFLSHATLEGVHWDKSVETGIQAYNHGMKFLVDEIGGEMFISLSIAPLFPGGYGHARRISCDTMGHISGRNESTEYMLNSLTYGWWTNRSVYIADPDEIPIGPVANQGARNENEARSRFLSAVISGGMILDSSAFLEDATARALAEKIYTNKRINSMAGRKAFRPLEGDTGDQSADTFVREDNGTYYLAVFNFDAEAHDSKHIQLERVAKALAGADGVAVTDVWTDTSLGRSIGTLNVSLGPAESKLLKLVP
jgi:hypothetical protein